MKALASPADSQQRASASAIIAMTGNFGRKHKLARVDLLLDGDNCAQIITAIVEPQQSSSFNNTAKYIALIQLTEKNTYRHAQETSSAGRFDPRPLPIARASEIY